MLQYDSTQAERERGCVWATSFESPTTEAKYRATVTGVVPINFGATFPGVNGNYIMYLIDGLNRPAVSFVFDFIPQYANDGTYRTFSETTVGSVYRFYKWTNDTIYINVNGADVYGIAYAAWGPYWKVGGRNVMVINLFNALYSTILNGVIIGTSANAFAALNPTTMYVGSLNTGNSTFYGKMLSLKIFTGATSASLITQQEARDYFNS